MKHDIVIRRRRDLFNIYVLLGLYDIFLLGVVAYHTNDRIQAVEGRTHTEWEHVVATHYLHRSSSYGVKAIHETFRCCGLNGYKSWAEDTTGRASQGSYRAQVPASCCAVADGNGACVRYHDRGCSEALSWYFTLLLRSVIIYADSGMALLVILVTILPTLNNEIMGMEWCV